MEAACQHMLMGDAAESLDEYLERVVRRLIERLLEDPDCTDWDAVSRLGPEDANRYIWLAKIRMAVCVRQMLDLHLRGLVEHGGGRRVTMIYDESETNEIINRPTWKEIGDALGVSAQAAHRKYSHLPKIGVAERKSGRQTKRESISPG
jgi:hypothetical protein